MKLENYKSLFLLLEKSPEVSAVLLDAALNCIGYDCSKPGPAKDVLEIWRHRAAWNKNPKNPNFGKMTGIDSVVEQLKVCEAELIIGHNLGINGTTWVIFTDERVSRLLGIIENRINKGT